MVKKIILVFKTHFDIGFTDLSSKVIQSYGNKMLDEVIRTCKATEHLGPLRYVWTMPAWPLSVIVDGCAPELKPELERLIQNGQIVWYALPFTSHTDFAAPEETARSLQYARKLSARYGKPIPVAAKMTDVPGHGLALPEVLSGAGVKFLHLGCNEFSTPPEVPRMFFWEGKAGGRVLTMYSPGGYGTGLVPPADWPYPVWMALMQTNDNCGPQSAEMIPEMARKAKEQCPDAEIVCGTMDDFYNELAKCDLSDLPVVAEDMADTWIHGVGSYPAEVSVVRENRERARRLHGLQLARLVAGEELPELQPLWQKYEENVALFEEHTWGADVKTWLGANRVYDKEAFHQALSEERYQFMETSWQEQRDRVTLADEALDEIERILTAGAGESLVHTNAAPLTGWVELPEAYRGKNVRLDGESVPVCEVNGRWCCHVKNLAPYRAARLEAGDEAPASALEIAKDGETIVAGNYRYRISFSEKDGRISEVFDRNLGEFILRGNVFGYQYDRYGIEDVTEYLRSYAYRFSTWGIQDFGRDAYPNCAHERFAPEFVGWKVEGDSVVFDYRTDVSSRDYGDSPTVLLTVTLPPEGEELFVELSLPDKQATPFIESGSLIFPFGRDAEYRIGKPGAEIDPKTDIRRRANHALFNLEHEVTVLGERAGVTICSKDAPLFAIGSTGVYEHRKEWTEGRAPEVWFDLFNNMWGTNFPQWIGGSCRWRFAVKGCSRDEANTARLWAATLCQGASVTGAAMPEGLEIPAGMQVAHLSDEPGARVVTLKELTGEGGLRRLTIPGAKLTPVDLMNRPIGEAKQDSIEFESKPLGLHAFRMD